MAKGTTITLTPLEKRMMKLYTTKEKIRRGDYLVSLNVGVQTFRLNCSPDTASEADWFRKMLAKAIASVVLEEHETQKKKVLERIL